MFNIQWIKRLFLKHMDFIKFCFVGASNTLISMVIYWLLLKTGLHYLLCSALSYAAGILNGYILSSKFVFKRSRSAGSLIRFVTVYGSSLLINLLILYILVDFLAFNKILAQLVSIAFNTVYNFTLNKLWTFK